MRGKLILNMLLGAFCLFLICGFVSGETNKSDSSQTFRSATISPPAEGPCVQGKTSEPNQESQCVIISPTRGVSWVIDRVYPISWSSPAPGGTVSISYSIDNGMTWGLIQSNLPNTGSYNWTVPDPASLCNGPVGWVCRVRIMIVIAYPGGSIGQCISDSFCISCDVPGPERAALTALYKSTNGDHWTNNSGWKTEPLDTDGFGIIGSEGKWYGITVDGDRVTAIDLHNNNLAGKLPDQLGDIGNLQHLRLEHNKLSGEVPMSLVKLMRLYDLNIDYNCLYAVCPNILLLLSCLDPEWQNRQDNCLEVPPSITVIAPGCGVSWVMSNKYFIRWNSSGSLGNLAIDYSIDNKTTWTPIVTNIPDTHAYEWTIPDIPAITSYLCPVYIRVRTVNGAIFGDSCRFCLSRDVPPIERNALIALYKATNGDGWLSNSGWKTPPLHTDGFALPGTEGNWFGITTLADHVARINLNHNNLTGSIPAALKDFNKLEYLYLEDNHLNGDIPTALTQLSQIKGVDIGSNCLKTSDPTLRSWLNTHNSGWEAHQDQCSGGSPKINLSQTVLNFVAIADSTELVTDPQVIWISNSGSDTLNWKTAIDVPWLSCTPTSGGSGQALTVSVNPGGVALGDYVGHIVITDPKAINSPQVIGVTLKIKAASSEAPPFGEFSTPMDGAEVSGSIAVTGWALDDLGIRSVKIYRESGNTPVFIGDAVLIEGARPDIQATYPSSPMNDKAGWGYMLLTNTLPYSADGKYKLNAIATDINGHETSLGVKTITVNNFASPKPFGTIDTPTQGGTASGYRYVNFGWALTPQPNAIPTDGSTIEVWVDGMTVGKPVYNLYRDDVAALFPNLANTNGAGGYFYLDTAKYRNGLHTIAWTVTDNSGNTDGIGSRYFNVINSNEYRVSPPIFSIDTGKLALNQYSPVGIRKGYKKDSALQTLQPDDQGLIRIDLREMERVEIDFLQKNRGGSMNVSELPIGSTFDRNRGVFCWQIGPGFLGDYRMTFVVKNESGHLERRDLLIRVGKN
ncbi:MAG: hypothetical protein ACM3SY_00660 [Candidatus Omnitrophota bacterium]